MPSEGGNAIIDNFQGKTAVVTGGASGIGLALCRRFAAQGARVVMADLAGDALDASARALEASGATVLPVAVDVRSAASVTALARTVDARLGGTDILCNNAGVQAPGAVWALSLADWQWVLEVNLWGQIHGIHAFVPGMISRGTPAHIVNTASMAGHLAYGERGPYTVSKFGVVGLSETLVQDLRKAGAPIGVSVLCPGFVQTNLYANSTRLRPSGGEVGPPGAGTAPAPARITPDGVADLVLDAVRNNRFWVLTHPEYRAQLEARLRGIVETGEVVPGT